ncbi:IclR family transcriptional regulator domain-containing protein [Modestobacter sp. URMC 112]
MDDADLDWLAAHGMSDLARLRSELASIRDRRWAEDRQLCVAGIKSLAVPVFGGTDRVIAAIAATLPVERRDDRQVLHSLWAAAADIGRGLRGQRFPRATGPSTNAALGG